MFVRLSLLRHSTESHIKWDKTILNPNKLIAESRFLQRYCSDIKRNEDLLFSRNGAGIVIPSPLKIKQTIKTGFYEFVDGPTCVQTTCPTCPTSTLQDTRQSPDPKIPDQNKHEKCLFVNKTTGELKQMSK